MGEGWSPHFGGSFFLPPPPHLLVGRDLGVLVAVPGALSERLLRLLPSGAALVTHGGGLLGGASAVSEERRGLSR